MQKHRKRGLRSSPAGRAASAAASLSAWPAMAVQSSSRAGQTGARQAPPLPKPRAQGAKAIAVAADIADEYAVASLFV